MRTPLRCRLIGHKWMQQRIEGETFRVCRRCKDRDGHDFSQDVPRAGPWQTSAGQTSPY